MKLSDLSDIAQVISGLAVLASLIYLSLQIRQNTLSHRASALATRSLSAREQLMKLVEPQVAALVLRGHAGDKSLSVLENYRYNAYVTAFFTGIDEQFWLSQEGILDKQVFDSQCVVLLGYLSQPGARTVWQFWKPRASPALRAFVEARLPALTAAPFSPFEERWNAAVVAASATSAP